MPSRYYRAVDSLGDNAYPGLAPCACLLDAYLGLGDNPLITLVITPLKSPKICITYIKEDLYRMPIERIADSYHYQHGVNIAQGFKAPAVIHRFTHNQSLLQTASDAVDWSFRYHGAASGTVLADERINGLSPYSGSELCTAVEAIFSLAYLYQALGLNEYADLAELATFNALPTMLSGDHWSHQYVAQPNQPWSRNLETSPFSNTNTVSQTFGLEPHYPCCTVNYPQGWPKYVANSWVRVGPHGFAHILLGPADVEIEGVHIRCTTDYPFSNVFEYTVHTDRPIYLHLRIPSWVDAAASSIRAVSLADLDETHREVVDETPSPDSATGLHKLLLVAGTSTISSTLHTGIRIMKRANDTIAIYHGALLFALEVKANVTSSLPKDYHQDLLPASYAPAKARDLTLTNASAWNIAIDPASLRYHTHSQDQLRVPIFESGGPPNYMTARGCQIEWPLFKGVTPGNVLPLKNRKCLGRPDEVRLVPYGSAMLHMAELPTIDLASQ